MVGSPEETPYDLRFQLLGVPVRVHPLFWLIMLVLGGSNLQVGLTFVACAFVSILVHEFGHALASRAVGNEPLGIVLFAMGGFCLMDVRRQTVGQRLFVLLAGPGAGFLLMGLVLGVVRARYGVAPADALALIGLPTGGNGLAAMFGMSTSGGAYTGVVVYVLLQINFWWGVLNLLPIYPLDGGRVAGVLLEAVDSWNGPRWTQVLSLLTAGGVAVYRASREDYFMALWFGFFAFNSYQALRVLQNSYRTPHDGGW